MFKKALFAKFEWRGLPEPLNDIFVERLIYNEPNFSVTMRGRTEFWSAFNVLEYSENELYSIPRKIQTATYRGNTKSTDDFLLFWEFNDLDQCMVSNKSYIDNHTRIIRQINHALQEHIIATELIATIYAASKVEADNLKRLYKNFNGVKIIENASLMPDARKGVYMTQFEITPRGKELEELKHEIENDLFLRLGIYTGTDKTHITNENLNDSEQVNDLINSYELKLRRDFAKRLTTWRVRHGNNTPVSVDIHHINADNTVERAENKTNTETTKNADPNQ